MLFRKIFAAAAACTLLSAGPAAAGPIYSPTGIPMEQASCKSNPMGCFEQASNRCQGPYQVLDSESHAGGLLADWLPGPVTWYSMVYQCGPSNGQMPAFEFRGPEWRAPSMASCSIYGQSVYCWGN